MEDSSRTSAVPSYQNQPFIMDSFYSDDMHSPIIVGVGEVDKSMDQQLLSTV